MEPWFWTLWFFWTYWVVIHDWEEENEPEPQRKLNHFIDQS